jgi:hypothetical protein
MVLTIESASIIEVNLPTSYVNVTGDNTGCDANRSATSNPEQRGDGYTDTEEPTLPEGMALHLLQSGSGPDFSFTPQPLIL